MSDDKNNPEPASSDPKLPKSSELSLEALGRLVRALKEEDLGRPKNIKKDPVILPEAPESVGWAQEQNQRNKQEDRLSAAQIERINAYKAKQFLLRTCQEIDGATKDNRYNGSTFTGAIITDDAKIVLAHLGDSPAALVTYDTNDTNTHQAKSEVLTEPHAPAQEYKEVSANENRTRIAFDIGGYRRILNESQSIPEALVRKIAFDEERVKDLGGIAMTHAFGDGDYGNDISKKPTMQIIEAGERLQPGKRNFLVVATDGILGWSKNPTGNPELTESMKNIARIIGQLLEIDPTITMKELSQGVMNQLVGEHADVNFMSDDNITFAITEIEKNKPKSIAIFDGHGGSKTAETALDIYNKRVKEQLVSAQRTMN